MARITRPLTNNEITPVKKTSPFMMVMACSCSSKPPVKNSGASVISDREAAAAQI